MEEKITYKGYNELHSKIKKEMTKSKQREKEIKKLEEELEEEIRPIKVEKGKVLIETKKAEKEELDEITRNAIRNAKKQILILKKEEQDNYEQKLLEFMKRKDELEAKKKSFIQTNIENIDSDKLRKIEESTQRGIEKIQEEKEMFIKEHETFLKNIGKKENEIAKFAMTMGISAEIGGMSLEEINQAEEEVRARAEEEARARAEEEARARAEEEARARAEEEARARAEEEARARAEEEARARAEEEARARAEEEARARAEEEARARVEEEARARAEEEARARAEEEARARAEEEARARAEEEARTRAEEEARARAEEEARARAEEEARARAEEEARARAEEEARARAEEEARARAEEEARARAEEEARARAEEEARARIKEEEKRQEQEFLRMLEIKRREEETRRAEEEARVRAEEEARARAEEEARVRAEEKAEKARTEEETRARSEEETRARAEEEARAREEEEEARARAEEVREQIKNEIEIKAQAAGKNYWEYIGNVKIEYTAIDDMYRVFNGDTEDTNEVFSIKRSEIDKKEVFDKKIAMHMIDLDDETIKANATLMILLQKYDEIFETNEVRRFIIELNTMKDYERAGLSLSKEEVKNDLKNQGISILYNLKGIYDKEGFSKEEREELLRIANRFEELGIAEVIQEIIDNSNIKIEYNAERDSYTLTNVNADRCVYMKRESRNKADLQELSEIKEIDINDLMNVDPWLVKALRYYDGYFGTNKLDEYIKEATLQGRGKNERKRDMEDINMSISYDLEHLYDEELADVEDKSEYKPVFSKEERKELLRIANRAKELGLANVRKGLVVIIREKIDNVIDKIMNFKNKLLPKGTEDDEREEGEEEREEVERTGHQKFMDKFKARVNHKKARENAEEEREEAEREEETI